MQAIQEETKGKKIVPPRAHTAQDMYEYYKKQGEGPKVNYLTFREVISRFNKRASDAVIFGQVLNLGARLGYVLIKKIRRNYEKPVPDWGESKRVKEALVASGQVPKDQDHPEGENWIVYYTDPWYLRWAWVKKRVCRVKNQTVYKFLPTANKSKKAGDYSPSKLGNRGKLVLANRMNPSLHTVYETHMKLYES